MQKLIISMVRLTAVMTLYGIEQLQTTSDLTQSGQSFLKVLDKFELALDSMTDALADKIDDSKKGTLKSVTNMTEEIVGRSFDGANLMDPRSLLRMTGTLWQKSSDALSELFGRSSPTADSEPKPAADVMS